jgi:hypothetical protein
MTVTAIGTTMVIKYGESPTARRSSGMIETTALKANSHDRTSIS